jgi:hypothetical protein
LAISAHGVHKFLRVRHVHEHRDDRNLLDIVGSGTLLDKAQGASKQTAEHVPLIHITSARGHNFLHITDDNAGVDLLRADVHVTVYFIGALLIIQRLFLGL